MKLLLLALGAMFLQTTFVALGKVLPAVLAPVVLMDLNISPSWFGIYIAIAAGSALIIQVGCGSFIVRYGALRVSQIAVLMSGLSMALLPTGLIPILVLSAVITGGVALSTPASSHLLGRYSPQKWAPLVFSIKQTSVPAGILIAGLLGPFLLGLYGWQNTFWIVAVSCVVFAIMLEPLRKEFDSDKNLAQKFHFSDFKKTITLVLGTPEILSLALACFAFVGLQATFTAFFVIYLTHLGYSLVEAGQIFAFATSVAILGRIFWGWLSSSYVSPRIMLAVLALAMAASVGLTGLFDENWPVWQITLVSAAVSATVFSWHGVLLAEAARLAPDTMRGTVTGGVLSFGQLGGLTLPLLYSAMLWATGSYRVGFIICAVPALVVGLILLYTARVTKIN
jgi:MFS family permease